MERLLLFYGSEVGWVFSFGVGVYFCYLILNKIVLSMEFIGLRLNFERKEICLEI